MATNNALSESVTQLLECAICFEQMSEPKMLPCQHTFCLHCLTQTADLNLKKMHCAICRKQHNLPKDGVKGFPNNLTLVALIDSMKYSANKKRKRESDQNEEIFQVCRKCNLMFGSFADLKFHEEECQRDTTLPKQSFKGPIIYFFDGGSLSRHKHCFFI